MKHKNRLKSVLMPLMGISLSYTLGLGLTNSQAQLIVPITQMGSDYLDVDPLATTATYSQSPTTLTFNSSYSLGATLGGFFLSSPKDWSAYSTSDFGLMMSIVGTNPNMPFTIEFYDSSLSIANTFTGSTTDVGSTVTFAPIALSILGTGNMNSIVGMQFTWDAPETINVTWSQIAVVPEPNVTSLLILSLLSLITGLGIKSVYNQKKKLSC